MNAAIVATTSRIVKGPHRDGLRQQHQQDDQPYRGDADRGGRIAGDRRTTEALDLAAAVVHDGLAGLPDAVPEPPAGRRLEADDHGDGQPQQEERSAEPVEDLHAASCPLPR
jgi:hypothetical protein